MDMSTHLDRSKYEIKPVTQSTALDLVTRYHYAKGGSNTGTFRHGLFKISDGENPLGVAWWIPPTKSAALSVSDDWRTVLCLTRLVVIPGMPTNSASFLLGASIKAIRRDGRFKTLVTYADEGQGHSGAIYRATNWTYAGVRPGDPVYLTESGRQVARKAGGVTRTNAQMLGLGYTNTGRTRKHKFVMRLEK